MGGKKKFIKKETKPVQKKAPVCQQPEEEKRFVNLLHVYTIYKQKFRRLSKGEFEELLRHGCKGKRAAIEICKEFMKAKQIPDEVDFEKNIGFLSVPRLMPLIALLAERAGYKMKPSLVTGVDFINTPIRIQEKFAHLMVDGFWFLGRVISDSLSTKDQVNRGNMFNFSKGDMGFWWAGVRILDWNYYAHREVDPESCYSFVTKDPPKYKMYTNRAIINMHQHPLYFLSEEDWCNYTTTVKAIKHKKVLPSSIALNDTNSMVSDVSPFWDEWEVSDVSTLSTEDLSSNASINTLDSRDSID